MTDYEKRGKAWYEAHKDEKLAEEKEKKRWLSYYERNRELVREKNRQRYYQRLGREAPPPKENREKVDTEKLERLESIVGELRELIPHVIKHRRTRKAAEAAPAAAPATTDAPAAEPAPTAT